uniref:(northern house mosquito) hypothetical protein n=1 Tax=Culex pipiens TaxID=7175 RepID=A0A8D8AMN0_CULPI
MRQRFKRNPQVIAIQRSPIIPQDIVPLQPHVLQHDQPILFRQQMPRNKVLPRNAFLNLRYNPLIQIRLLPEAPGLDHKVGQRRRRRGKHLHKQRQLFESGSVQVQADLERVILRQEALGASAERLHRGIPYREVSNGLSKVTANDRLEIGAVQTQVGRFGRHSGYCLECGATIPLHATFF